MTKTGNENLTLYVKEKIEEGFDIDKKKDSELTETKEANVAVDIELLKEKNKAKELSIEEMKLKLELHKAGIY